MLDERMKRLIRDHRAGMVATVRDDGMPSVSPKATFVVLDDRRIAFGNIRSPQTVANLRKRPAVEVCFIDVLKRQAVRVKGTAKVTAKAAADENLQQAFAEDWPDYIEQMSAFVDIAVEQAELVFSPAYDLGHTEAELHETNLKKLQALQ